MPLLLGTVCLILGFFTNHKVLEVVYLKAPFESSVLPVIFTMLSLVFLFTGVCLLSVALEAMRPLRKLLKIAALSAGALGVPMLTVAAVIQLFPSLFGMEEPAYQLFDLNPNGTGSFRHRPNLDLVIPVGGIEIAFRTNEFGMRWYDVDKERPPSKQRIALLGDSFTEGMWSSDLSMSFAGVFAASLDTTRFEVLNFGTGGFGFDDMLLQLEEEVRSFDPQYLVIVAFMGNDYRDTYLGLNKMTYEEGRFTWDRNIWDALISKDREDVLSNFLRVGEIRLINLLKRVRDAGVIDNYPTPDQEFSVASDFGSYTFWSAQQLPDVGTRAVERAEMVLDSIRTLAEANGIEVVHLLLPYREQVYATTERSDKHDIRKPQEYYLRYCEDRHLRCLDVFDPMREATQASRISFYWNRNIDEHFNDRGHQFVGERLARFFEEEVLSTVPGG